MGEQRESFKGLSLDLEYLEKGENAMKERESECEEEKLSEHEKRMEHLAEELVEALEFNAWEYGNTGNFLYN